jgi:dTMP kinase
VTARFITLEGPDGVGKTEQARRLAFSLQRAGHSVHLLTEPADCPIGSIIRRAQRHEVQLDRRTMALLYTADRQQNSPHIEAMLADGTWIIGDRGALSTWAYAAASSHFDPDVVAWADTLSMFCAKPDLILVLRAPVDVCLARLRDRGADPEMYEDRSTQEHVHVAYDNARNVTMLRRVVRYVDATGTPGAVEARIAKAVAAMTEREAA